MKKSLSFYKIDVYVMISNILSNILLWYFLTPIIHVGIYVMISLIALLNISFLFYFNKMKTEKNRWWTFFHYLILGSLAVNVSFFLNAMFVDIIFGYLKIVAVLFLSALIVASSRAIGKSLAERKLNEINFRIKQIYEQESLDWKEREEILKEEYETKYEKIIAENDEKHKQEIADLNSQQLFQMEQYKQKVHKERVEGLQLKKEQIM